MQTRDEEALSQRPRAQVVRNTKAWDILDVEMIRYADAFIRGE